MIAVHVALMLLVSIISSVLLPAATSARAAQIVELLGRVVAVNETRLTVEVDGAVLNLDASEVDRRFLDSLVPGDDVRITAFRLPDGSLLVYNIFVHPDRDEEPRVEPSQGGTD